MPRPASTHSGRWSSSIRPKWRGYSHRLAGRPAGSGRPRLPRSSWCAPVRAASACRSARSRPGRSPVRSTRRSARKADRVGDEGDPEERDAGVVPAGAEVRRAGQQRQRQQHEWIEVLLVDEPHRERGDEEGGQVDGRKRLRAGPSDEHEGGHAAQRHERPEEERRPDHHREPVGDLPQVAGATALPGQDRLVDEGRDREQHDCHRHAGDESRRGQIRHADPTRPAQQARAEDDRAVRAEQRHGERDRSQRERVAPHARAVGAEAARGGVGTRGHQAAPFDDERSERSERDAEQRGPDRAPAKGPRAPHQEPSRHQRQPHERLPRKHGSGDPQTGHGEGHERSVGTEPVDALEGEQGEEDRQVVGEQRERGPEEVGREDEQKGEREGLPRLERRSPAQEPQQRQRRAVREPDVEQPQLPQVEPDQLTPGGREQVIERRLRGRIAREVETLGELKDRWELVDPGVAPVEGVDLDGESLEDSHSDQERHGQQGGEHPPRRGPDHRPGAGGCARGAGHPSGSGRGGRKRGTTSTAMIAAMIRAAPSQPVTVRRSSFRSQPKRPAKAGSDARMSAVRAGGACCWANDWTKNPSALATREVTISADHTVAPSGRSSWPAAAPIARQVNPTTPSWTASSAPTWKRSTALAVARMCAASEIAQTSTSPSPRRSKSPPAPDSSHSPNIETAAAAHAMAGIRWPRKTAPRTGVSTTKSPVMKPAFEALVSSSPSVWKMYPPVRKTPITRPARQPSGGSVRRRRWKMTATISAAGMNRYARKAIVGS